MSMKRYGIYLFYSPGAVNFRGEGLGRYISVFLKGAMARGDTRFAIVCPSWTRKSLEMLFEEEAVQCQFIDIVSPKKVPVVLHLYHRWLEYQKGKRKTSLLNYLVNNIRELTNRSLENTFHRISKAESISALVFRLIPDFFLILLFLIFLPLWGTTALAVGAVLILKKIFNRLITRMAKFKGRLQTIIAQPKDDPFVLRMYRAIEQHEIQRMQELINGLTDVRAWYCPIPPWPAFNNIQAPRLMCVPDVVMVDFPVGYAGVGGDRTLETFHRVGTAIRGGDYFVTYSDNIKWKILVDRYAVPPERVTVIPHAPNDLSRWVQVSGFADPEEASRKYCERLIINAIQRSRDSTYARTFQNRNLKFLFYASQFRPNKNVLTLLRAYEYLLRKKLIGHKLIMTGHPSSYPPVSLFIAEHHLENDVLFLHRLKIQELAACYKLADLAVNPSLSEGGCPFTFSEALSVNTPVVMARIPVTEELLKDPELQEMTFFDPYDWKSLAERIEWALSHRDYLLEVQRRIYDELSRRTWADVVDEHLFVLEKIAQLQPSATSLP